MRAFSVAVALLFGMVLCPASPAADEVPDPFREYTGKEPVPDGLRKTYTGFVTSAKGGSVEAYLLPHGVKTSREPRPKDSPDFGEGPNEHFLKNGFSPEVRSIRADGDDCYLIRTDSSAIWFVQNRSGAWKVYRYIDKPIQ